MADTLETLEIKVQHSATSAATEIKAVASAVRSLGNALEKALPSLTVFQRTLGKNNFNVNQVDNSQIANQITNIKQASQKAQSATKEVSKSIREVSHEAKKAKGPLQTFADSLKRIAMYRLLRTIIKAITQAFKEGMEWAYTFSNGVAGEGHRFAEAMDSMTSASTKMKAQLGSAFISLLALIAPIVNQIISLVTMLANALSQLFAVFTGGTYLKAQDVSAEFADTMKSGAGAAKEWKNQLLGFDVINRLEEPSKGGGGGGNAIDPMSLFEDTEITGWFAMLKQKWDNLVGSINFEPLINAWTRLKTVVGEFVGIVNHALLWAWNNILEPLAHWTIEKAAPALVNLLASAFEFLNAVLRKIGPLLQTLWDKVLSPIFSWIGNVLVRIIEWLGDALSSLAKKIENAHSLQEFLESLDGKAAIVLAMAAAIILVTSSMGLAIIVVTLLALAIYELYKHWDSIVGLFKSTSSSVGGFFESVKAFFTNVWESIVSFVKKANEISWQIVNIFFAITSPIASVCAVIQKNLASIINFLKGVFTIQWGAAWQGIVNFFIGIANSIRNIVNTIISMINAVISAIRSLLASTSLFTSVGFGSNASKYATGGFPEDGLFFANHNELVGQFSNGKTAVANNQQIIEGIKQGVYEAMSMAGGNKGGAQQIVFNVNGKEFARAIYNDQKAVAKEHGISMVTT